MLQKRSHLEQTWLSASMYILQIAGGKQGGREGVESEKVGTLLPLFHVLLRVGNQF